jgi:ABC-type uncharacterized transport system substrate-binding protein
MRRRLFLGALGAAVAGPRVAMAQPTDRKRRVGILMSTAEADPHERALVAEFVRALAKRGWIEGRNLETIVRWGNGTSQRLAANARDIVARAPDAILSKGANVPAARQATSTIPIVFVVLSDASAQEYVANFAHPGGNLTGFTSQELELVGKRLQLLREMSPQTARALYLRSRGVGAGNEGLYAAVVKDAASSGVTVIDGACASEADIDRAVAAFARRPNGGLIVAFNAFTTVHREEIVALAARYHFPAVYPLDIYARGGGLMSYAFSQEDEFRQAAVYVDRILKGARPADLPVQQPTTFRLVINLKTAGALGLTVPQLLLAQADEVIE